MTRTRLRSATATMPASRTSENRPDTMSSPPSISSTKGAQMKKRASAMRSCTVEKRRNLSGHLINSVVMLSEAKHLCSWSLGNGPQENIQRFFASLRMTFIGQLIVVAPVSKDDVFGSLIVILRGWFSLRLQDACPLGKAA